MSVVQQFFALAHHDHAGPLVINNPQMRQANILHFVAFVAWISFGACVVRREQAAVQGITQLRDPGMMEIMKNPSDDFSPIMNRHDRPPV